MDALEKKILQQDEWTFQECLGLATDFDVKPRFVVARVLASGKNYVDGDTFARNQKLER